jgi:hypothetical protein
MSRQIWPAGFTDRISPAFFFIPSLHPFKGQAAQRWIEAVNADGSYGVWNYVVVRKPTDVPKAIGEAAKRGVGGGDLKALTSLGE